MVKLKNNLLILVVSLLLSLVIFSNCHAQSMKSASTVSIIDTITYRAQVWAEIHDIKEYGGKKIFKKKLKEFFKNTTWFWNTSPNKFKYYFRFVPAGLRVYNNHEDKDNYRKNLDKAFGELDTTKYDYVLFLGLNAKENGTWTSGGGASGQAVVVCLRTSKNQEKYGSIFAKQPPEKGTYSDLGHEYGHMRGATDLYQYVITPENNPVNHKAYNPPASNMGTGFHVWSDYESTLFNYDAYQKQLNPNLTKNIFPDTLQIRVLVHGTPHANVTVKLFGTRAGGANNNVDVYPQPFRIFTTNENGVINITDVYKLYHPSLDDLRIPPLNAFPYHYWFSFLIQAEYEGKKEYVWVPDWETQIAKMKGNNTYEAVISF